MQGRSWMAALTLAAGTICAVVSNVRAEDQRPGQQVTLNLSIAGLSGQGCDVEVKPANPSCVFRPVTKHVGSDGKSSVLLSDVTSNSADRECAFAITIKEAGQGERTAVRGFRLASRNPNAVSSMECFLSAPSKLAKSEQSKTRR